MRGDLEETSGIQTDSLTASKTSINLFYLIAVQKGWMIETADIKCAFLQGAELDREVFLCPPRERRIEGVVWKMKKRAYGFVDASRGFYIEL